MKNRWTISELSAQTALALTKLDLAQDSGRVSEAPSSLTIRFYTTHGLLDRPCEFKGRTALYDDRHLFQLVAIKTLQSLGRPLSDIQELLLGANDDELREIAGLIDDHSSVSKEEETKTRRDSFWKERVILQQGQSEETVHGNIIPAIQLAEGVTLVLESADLLDNDLQHILAAAEPLVALLKKRRIIRPKP